MHFGLGLPEPAAAIVVKRLLLLDRSNRDDRIIQFLPIFQAIRRADNASLWLLFMREADKDGHVFVVAVDEASGAVDRVDPQAGILDAQLSIYVGTRWQHVLAQRLVLEVYASLVLLALLADDPQSREVQLQSLDDHGLDLEIGLSGRDCTSVTGSSPPLLYSLKE